MLIDRPTITETSYISNAVIDSGLSDPSNPDQGELFFRTDLASLRVYNGSQWVSIPNFDAGDNLDLGAGDITTTGTITGGVFSGAATNLTGTASALSIGGNSATSTVLQTARNVSISGGATGTATSFDGSADIAIPVTSLDADALLTGTVPAARLTGTYTIDVTGNSDTATALETARTIGVSGITGTAQSFDGTANITIPVSAVPSSLLTGTIAPANLSGSYNIDVTGSAATLAPGATINGVNFDGSAPITVTAAAGTLTGTTLNATVVSSSLTSVGTLAGLSVGGAANFTNTVTLAADPTAALHAATKQYVDNLIANGVSWKQAARVATTGNITLSGLQTIDGVTVVVADRVLVRAQTDPAENGIYEAATGAWSRTADANTGVKLASASVFVQQGTTYQDVAWVQTADNITLGVTPLAWVQFSTAGGGVAGNGITITGTTIAVNAGSEFAFSPALNLAVSGVTAGTYGSGSTPYIPVLVIDSKGRVTSATNSTPSGSWAINAATATTAATVTNTNLGALAHSITTMATNADWARPSGYQTMVGAAGSTALPGSHGETFFGYTVTSKRDVGGGYSGLLTGYSGNSLWFTYTATSGTAPVWRKVLSDNNFNTYSPTLTGGGASGTWSINITGDAATLGGYAPSTTQAANTIPVRNASGYTFFGYINSNTSNGENPTVAQVIVTNGGDNFYRKASLSHFGSQLGGTAINWTAAQNFISTQAVGVATQSGTLAAYSTGGNAATMSFHRAGNYAINMGLDNDNVFRLGGWSDGASTYRWQSYPGGSLRIGGALYPNGGARFLQNNTGTYGCMELDGGTSGNYYGIYLPSAGGTTFGMYDGGGNGGAYDTTTGWHFYWNRSNQCLGIGGSDTAAGYRARVNGSLYVDSNIVAVGDITAFSDRRLKTDIEPILEPLEKVSALNGVTFKRTDTGEYQTGLIAQEVQAVMPNAVVETENGMLAVAYGNLAGLFTEAIKTLNREVAALRAEVQTLKEELSNRS